MEKQGRRHHISSKLFHHSVSDCSLNASDDGLLVHATNNTSSSKPSIPIPIPIPIKQLFTQTKEIKEMDFFSDNNIMNDDADDDEEPRRQPQQDCNNNPPAVNTGLNLLTLNSGISSTSASIHQNSNNKLITSLQVELERLHEENGELKTMLDQMTKSYSQLQTQLLIAMKKQAQDRQRELD